jgi:hypothetical protein
MNDADNAELAEAVAVEEAPVSERPEWLPEKFNTPEDMAASYSSLESKLGQGQDEIRAQIEQELEISALEGRPETAGDYELPEQINEAEAVDNEMLAWWAEHSFENGYSQEEFADGIAKYAAYMEGQGPDLDAERQALGENADARIEAVDLWAGKNVPEEFADQVELLGQSAQGIKMLEHFMSQSQQASPQGQFVAPQATNEDQLKTMMQDPRYWNPSQRDPNYVKQVQEGFSKLYR